MNVNFGTIDEAEPKGDCLTTTCGMVCTRDAGHPPPHVAGVGGREAVGVWGDDRSTD